MKAQCVIRTEIANRQSLLPVPRGAIGRLVRAAGRGIWEGRVISVAVVDGPGMAALNRRFTGREGVTDVLAFSYDDDKADDDPVGEIIVCASCAQSEAAARGVHPTEELLLYVAHGLAHLMGLDDATREDRRRMYACEAALLREAGIRNVRRCGRGGKTPRGIRRERSALRAGTFKEGDQQK